jgi:hypothetical protein
MHIPKAIEQGHSTQYLQTCITETNEIEDPRSDGGLVNLDFGLAEKAVGDADRTFKT